MKVMLDLDAALNGGLQLSCACRRSTPKDGYQMRERVLNVQIPRGILPGQTIRLAGPRSPAARGRRPDGSAAAGDLYIEVEFQPHPLYRLDGRDLYLDLPVTPVAALGATVKTPTPGGTAAELKIPAGSKAEQIAAQGPRNALLAPGRFLRRAANRSAAGIRRQGQGSVPRHGECDALRSPCKPRSVTIMSQPDEPCLSGEIFEEGSALSVNDLRRLIAVEERHVIEWVEEGVISVIEMDAAEWRFSGAQLRRARIALRLERDLELPCRRGPGARIAGGAQ